MAEILFHHYPLSPFSEKVRRVLAYKQLPWRAVEQPIMAPKPELTQLTGGYRRIPVLQIGADIYCDTALILRVLEQRHPTPACLPAPLAGAVSLLEDWADHRLFMQTVPPTIVRLLDQLPPAFTRESLIAGAPHALSQALISLDRLETQLRQTPFVLGDTFTLADAACFHPVWFMQHGGDLFDVVRARPALAAWFDRIAAFGPGMETTMAAGEAMAVARAAQPADVLGGDADPDHPVGDEVSIVPDDYGLEETRGRVARVSADEIVVLRADPEVGDIAVHYPRAGYRISRV